MSVMSHAAHASTALLGGSMGSPMTDEGHDLYGRSIHLNYALGCTEHPIEHLRGAPSLPCSLPPLAGDGSENPVRGSDASDVGEWGGYMTEEGLLITC